MLRRDYPSLSLGWFLIVAGLVHFWFSQLRFPEGVLPELKSKADKKDEIVVEKWDPKAAADRPVVRTERAPDPKEPKKDERPAPFAGEFRNRVEKQTQAERKGRFQSGARLVPVPDPEGDGEGERTPPGWGDLLAFPQSPNALPEEIVRGNQTLLDTDPVLYASFINRVADEIYDPWVANATQAVDLVYATGRRLDGAVYITKLTVVIDRQGNVASMTVLKSSGVRELDEAPKKAFWDAEPFPNPPSQMFEEDGLVRFVYEFHFEWKAAGFNIVPLI